MTIAMLLTLNNPERIKAEIQQEGRLQQQLRNASNPLERLFIRTRIATRHITDSSTIRPNQLIIVDEAGMTDTRLLQWITKLAEFHGAKVILTGDPKQLDSVSGAGGHARLRRPAREMRTIDQPLAVHRQSREMGGRSGRSRFPTTLGRRGRRDAPAA